jgi:hypothetical protein
MKARKVRRDVQNNILMGVCRCRLHQVPLPYCSNCGHAKLGIAQIGGDCRFAVKQLSTDAAGLTSRSCLLSVKIPQPFPWNSGCLENKQAGPAACCSIFSEQHDWNKETDRPT